MRGQNDRKRVEHNHGHKLRRSERDVVSGERNDADGRSDAGASAPSLNYRWATTQRTQNPPSMNAAIPSPTLPTA